MSDLLSFRPVSDLVLLMRARALRQRASEVYERAAGQATHIARLLHTVRPEPADAEDHPDVVDAAQWCRAQVHEMLAAGWTREELADVGVTDALLRELGLDGAAAG